MGGCLPQGSLLLADRLFGTPLLILELREALEPSGSHLLMRVTALSIAGNGGGGEVKRLAEELARNPETPVMLRKVAERVVR